MIGPTNYRFAMKICRLCAQLLSFFSLFFEQNEWANVLVSTLIIRVLSSIHARWMDHGFDSFFLLFFWIKEWLKEVCKKTKRMNELVNKHVYIFLFFLSSFFFFFTNANEWKDGYGDHIYAFFLLFFFFSFFWMDDNSLFFFYFFLRV